MLHKLEIVFRHPQLPAACFLVLDLYKLGLPQISKTLFNHTFRTSGNKPEFPSQTLQPDHLSGRKQIDMIFVTSSTP